MKNLQDFLNNHPHIEKVFLNQSGGWMFSRQGDHTIEMNRDEILAIPTEDKVEPVYTVADNVGELIEGESEEDLLPRAGTWLEERRNWQAEVNQNREYIEILEKEIENKKGEIEALNKDLSNLSSSFNSLKEENEKLKKAKKEK